MLTQMTLINYTHGTRYMQVIFMRYRLPINVRQIEHLVQRSLLQTSELIWCLNFCEVA